MQKIIVLVALVGLILSTSILSYMLIMEEQSSACVIHYNSALADVKHMQEQMGEMWNVILWMQRQRDNPLPAKRWEWNI
jgi:hypothetical protein